MWITEEQLKQRLTDTKLTAAELIEYLGQFQPDKMFTLDDVAVAFDRKALEKNT